MEGCISLDEAGAGVVPMMPQPQEGLLEAGPVGPYANPIFMLAWPFGGFH
jgi:hypothetical protein